MIIISDDGKISYSGNKKELIEAFICFASNISTIAELDLAETDRLITLSEALIKGENIEKIYNIINSFNRTHIVELYSELGIKKIS